MSIASSREQRARRERVTSKREREGEVIVLSANIYHTKDMIGTRGARKAEEMR
jgi:hypothetical protein